MNIFYFVLLLLPAMILFIIADKKNKKVFLYFSIIYISLIVGLRGINVGIDTKPYYNALINDFPIRWQFEEMGFRNVSRVLMTLFRNPTIVILIYSFITHFLIISRLWDFRKKCNFSVMIFLYLLIYLFSTMNIMRQFISIAIVFYSTKLLEKKKFVLFLIIVLIASQIHKTALLSLIYIVIYYWNNLNKKQKFLLIMPISIVLIVVLKFVIDYETDHITNYFSSENSISNMNITFFYRIFIFGLSYILYKTKIKIYINKTNYKNTNVIDYNDKNEFKKICTVYLLGLLFSAMGMFFAYMTRIGLYYLCYELLYWGYITKNSKNNFFNFSLISIYAVYVFMMELIYNGSGIFPYYIMLME